MLGVYFVFLGLQLEEDILKVYLYRSIDFAFQVVSKRCLLMSALDSPQLVPTNWRRNPSYLYSAMEIRICIAGEFLSSYKRYGRMMCGKVVADVRMEEALSGLGKC